MKPQHATDNTQEAAFARKLARSLGISQKEYRNYTPSYHDENNPNGYYYEFPPETPPMLLQKIDGIVGHTFPVDNNFNAAIAQMDDPGPDGSISDSADQDM